MRERKRKAKKCDDDERNAVEKRVKCGKEVNTINKEKRERETTPKKRKKWSGKGADQ